ncbi:pyridoxamine 5'-phosphate oxidase family protein [Pseudonocardia sp.]|uniref:pyridoxamine 5'-phosphate oxidase family protein n=1 Tax=Pseudonocardia sp. TaxID=60912 RepID=UPI00262FE2F0|nr:pyridoxamine 5'-phosphate oxidase family protein [Pseudonocardia sp.]
MGTVRSIEELAALYDAPVPTSLTKEVDHLTDLHRRYVEASPFVLIATSGPDGSDCSPRGDAPGFVRVADERTLLLPDRRGNNRLDTLRNIVVDGRVGLLFLVPGVGVTLRVNGTAELTTDDALRESFAVRGKLPTTVLVVRTAAVYTQCPKALVRSHLWDAGRHRDPAELPPVGQIMAAITEGRFDGEAYDRAYPERLRQTIY